MPEKLLWSPGQDATIKRLRAEGVTWDRIAAAVCVSRFAVIERGRRIGAARPSPELKSPPEDTERPPLPPGHPSSWQALIGGTVLEGSDYPMPVFVT